MSLAANLQLFSQAVGTDLGAVIKSRGDLATLTTTQKSTLVAAINELVTRVNDTGAVAAALINDTTTGDDTTYSSDKIVALLTQLKNEILGGVGEAYDTLKEIADYLAANDGAMAGLLTSINNKVSYAEAQALTTAQKLQACTNIGIGDPEVDLAAAYATAKAAAMA